MGARNPSEAKAVLVRRARKRLGVEAVRAHSWWKIQALDRVLGPNDSSARRRRRDAQRAYRERRAAYERQYQYRSDAHE